MRNFKTALRDKFSYPKGGIMSSTLKIIVWDVQHGNAIYMKTPNGTNIMFDIGAGIYGSGRKFSPLRRLKYKGGVDCLHYLVISHPHADHISDISNMFDLKLKPEFLCRPKGIAHDDIKRGNRYRHRKIIKRYLELDRTYATSTPKRKTPLNPNNNGGVKIKNFRQTKKGTSNLNNYSIVSVVEYANEKILIPGDIESAGWEVLMGRGDFLSAIEGTTIFVASHHGRKAGFYSEVFDYFTPDVVIVSDGRYSDTSVTSRYGDYTQGVLVNKRNGNPTTRLVLTTRNDGPIYIKTDGYNKEITIN